MNKPDVIKAKIIADSINRYGVRITSWELEYPRFLHSEWMTHRVFSRNSASSRAIPFDRILEQVRNAPAHPIIYTSESGKVGMQGGTDLTEIQISDIKRFEADAKTEASACAILAHERGAHRSIVNRWIEPWMTIKIIATATNHENLFALRAHPAALPDFQVLAYRMLDRYLKSAPKFIEPGGWHMPYSDLMPEGLSIKDQLKIATARACWASYARPDKTEFVIEDAFKRHDDCIIHGHFSPLEHCAQAVEWTLEPGIGYVSLTGDFHNYPWSNFDLNGQPSGWGQYRKTILTECGDKNTVSLSHILHSKPDWITL